MRHAWQRQLRMMLRRQQCEQQSAISAASQHARRACGPPLPQRPPTRPPVRPSTATASWPDPLLPPSCPARAPAEVTGKFAASAWGKKLAARASKAAMTDFDRYKAAVARAQAGRKVRQAINQLKKSA